MPKRPAVARRRALKGGPDLVDRARMRAARDRPVGADLGRPAAFRVHDCRAGGDHPALDQGPKGDSRLLAPLGDRADYAFVERERRGDPLTRDLDIGRFALDPDPTP